MKIIKIENLLFIKILILFITPPWSFHFNRILKSETLNCPTVIVGSTS
ncbi:unnamed protein product, partial [Vitis vinifera]|uniref:Uncharacterized protein n=1 Tax=Vitis vinifera TaxID=29760 RepID=E0CPI6_VITVI